MFGTSSCEDGGNAAAVEKFRELVLAYETVLEAKGDRKLRGLKDIHRQLENIVASYPDADVTIKILSDDIVGINLSRVERAIQKLDPYFNKQAETIVVGNVSSYYEVMEAPYKRPGSLLDARHKRPRNAGSEASTVPPQVTPNTQEHEVNRGGFFCHDAT